MSGPPGSEVVSVAVGSIADKGILEGVGGEAVEVTITDSALGAAVGSGVIVAKASGEGAADVVIAGIDVSALKYGDLTITATVEDGAGNAGDGFGVGGDGDGTSGTQAVGAVPFEDVGHPLFRLAEPCRVLPGRKLCQLRLGV